jgi:hypothetical protein
VTTRELLARAVAATAAVEIAGDAMEQTAEAAKRSRDEFYAAHDAAVEAVAALRAAAGDYVRCDGRLYRVRADGVEEVVATAAD